MRRQTYFAKPGEIASGWKIVDATDVPLGRLAVEVATVLMGKHRPDYTPHVACGDYVVVTNAAKVALTGKKADQRLKLRYTGYPGGLKERTMREQMELDSTKVVYAAVRGMLPHNRLGRSIFNKLKVYRGENHPHAAQNPTPISI